MRSIRQQLLIFLLSGMLLSTLAAGIGVYFKVSDEAGELFDYQLVQIADAVPAQFPPQLLSKADPNAEHELVVQVWNKNGKLVYASDSANILPRFPNTGFSTVMVLERSWRILNIAKQDRFILAAQAISARDELVFTSAIRSLLPFIILIPVLGVFIGFVVDRTLRSLWLITQTISDRSEHFMQPITVEKAPAEIQPLIHALNRLLFQLERSMSIQNAFIADAAHELRSPLTALKLQLQLAERAKSEKQRMSAYTKLHERLERSTRLIQQLLTLARHDGQIDKESFIPVDLGQLAQCVMTDHSALAESKHISLTVKIHEAPVIIHGHPDGLAIMLGNLINNALGYTAEGGRVDIRVLSSSDGSLLHVIDTGPGILPGKRERVFDRFYREETANVAGSGLGLAIVKSIVIQHGATIHLSDNPLEQGLLVTVVFPIKFMIP